MERIRVTPGTAVAGRVHIRPRVRIQRANLSYLQERGWVCNGNCYRGLFRTKHGNWWGEVQHEGGCVDFFIYDPPRQVLNGPHGSCFTHIGNNWWWVHFFKESPNVSDGVIAIERILSEALQP